MEPESACASGESMTKLRFALLTLALVLTFAARTPKPAAACLRPCSEPDGTYILVLPGGCCTSGIHSFQRYNVAVCMGGCAVATGNTTCSTNVCNPR
jgi:hypothetical protein